MFLAWQSVTIPRYVLLPVHRSTVHREICIETTRCRLETTQQSLSLVPMMQGPSTDIEYSDVLFKTFDLMWS